MVVIWGVIDFIAKYRKQSATETEQEVDNMEEEQWK